MITVLLSTQKEVDASEWNPSGYQKCTEEKEHG